MKRCPECRRDYTADTLNFCLADGAELHGLNDDEPATAVLNSEAPTRVHGTPTSLPRRNSVIAGVVGIALVTLLGLGGYLYYGRGSGRQIDSIAVMPFVNESGNPEFEYVADGVTEELISTLTRFPDLTVKRRSTIIRYKGQNADAKTLGRELQVAAILNGSVAQRGDEMALHVELVDAATDIVLWPDDYRKPLSAFATLQNEIARDISDQLRAKLSNVDQQKLVRRHTDNPEAYQLYRKGRFHRNKSTREDVLKSIEYYQQAIKLDPNYALAYAGLADAYMNLPGYDRSAIPH